MFDWLYIPKCPYDLSSLGLISDILGFAILTFSGFIDSSLREHRYNRDRIISKIEILKKMKENITNAKQQSIATGPRGIPIISNSLPNTELLTLLEKDINVEQQILKEVKIYEDKFLYKIFLLKDGRWGIVGVIFIVSGFVFQLLNNFQH